MSLSRHRILVGSIIVAVVAIPVVAVGILNRHHAPILEENVGVVESRQELARKEPVGMPSLRATDNPAVSAAAPMPETPQQAASWDRWTEAQRLDFVTRCQRDPRLPPELLAFFKRAIHDKALRPVTRNNMANCLVDQDVKDPALAGMFREMALDRGENEVWRDYSLQFMAASIDWAADRSAIASTVWDMARQESGSIAGTAIIHLHYIAERGVAALPIGYEAKVAALVTDGNAHIATRMTAIGIIGQERLSGCAPALRHVVESAQEPALRRTALASLGLLGNADDLPLVRRFTHDSDALVAKAAQGAARRLLASRTTTPAGTNLQP
jgi:hypothetical protein